MDDPNEHPPKEPEKENGDKPPEPFWQDWDVTSDDDVKRDTYTPARQRDLKRDLGDD
jgi:hypothetical protein